MDSEQYALLLEQLRRDVVAGVPGSDHELAVLLRASLRQYFRAPDRDELIQTTLVRIWRALPAFEPNEEMSFRNWVSMIAARVAVDSRRQQTRWPIRAGQFPEQPDTGPSPSQWLYQRQQLRLLRSALDVLSSKYARAVRHHFRGGQAKDLAESENIALGTAYWRRHEGLRRLQRLIMQKIVAQTTPS